MYKDDLGCKFLV